ncbi:hypothetical protein OG311_38980 (plasmid) [Streptomyces sp. NBC_01343]|uniref:hypothetical protein n=1 Tax=Streptomyces sp. NBC_01343 TaxID=2903832 RepID=UPI002E128B25|nr:hypothetical protein OG311_38980 [Streptomyces sp. NBC_01343]
MEEGVILSLSMPEGWEWLDEMPDEWHPPEELKEPSNAAEINLAIQILSCDSVSLEIRALVGRFVTEQSQFTSWFLREVKGSGRDLSEVALISRSPLKQTRLVFEAWKRFQECLNAAGRDEDLFPKISASKNNLAGALTDAVDALVAARRK